MEKYFFTVTNERGDVLAGYRVQVADSNGDAVSIFADANGTQFSVGGGAVNYATSSATGLVEFYWEPARGQDLQTLDPSGNLVSTIENFADIIAFPVPVSEQTGTSYTLTLDDGNSVVQCNNASPISLTIPPNADAAIPVGSFVEVHQAGAGAITIAAGSGVTLNSRGSLVVTSGLYAVVGLRKVDTNVWVLAGDLA
jgi:hypothetical protein